MSGMERKGERIRSVGRFVNVDVTRNFIGCNGMNISEVVLDDLGYREKLDDVEMNSVKWLLLYRVKEFMTIHVSSPESLPHNDGYVSITWHN